MNKIETIAIADIHVPERLRDVDEDHALAIQTSIVEHGLLNPITVRRTPNAKGGKFTLVAGAHRLRAVQLNDESDIDAIIVDADKLTAVLMEIEENLFRNDLSALDRAIFVQTYRDVWEQKHGRIKPGNPEFSNRGNLPPMSPVDVIAQEALRGFSTVCAERLGMSEDTIKRANRIAQAIPAEMKRRLAGTAIANNQSALLKLAKLPNERLANAAKVFDAVDGDFDKMMDALGDAPPKQNAADKTWSRLVDTWGRVRPRDRIEFVREHRADIEVALAVLDAEGKSGGGRVTSEPNQIDLESYLAGGAA